MTRDDELRARLSEIERDERIGSNPDRDRMGSFRRARARKAELTARRVSAIGDADPEDLRWAAHDLGVDL